MDPFLPEVVKSKQSCSWLSAFPSVKAEGKLRGHVLCRAPLDWNGPILFHSGTMRHTHMEMKEEVYTDRSLKTRGRGWHAGPHEDRMGRGQHGPEPFLGFSWDGMDKAGRYAMRA